MSHEEKRHPDDSLAKREQELDDFWDIGRLLPKEPKGPRYTPQSIRKTPEAVEIEVAPVKHSARPSIKTVTVPPTGSSPLSFSHEAHSVTGEQIPEQMNHQLPPSAPGAERCDVLLCEYTPQSPLLHHVSIYEWHANYHYFDQFIKDAETYAGLGGKEVKAEPFFSYFPQYAQLNRRQRAWYLYWRDQVRQDLYPPTDYAYILLYLFELINLPAIGETAERHRDLIAKVWMAYRKTYPQLDHYVCEWLCDYCLIHNLSAPALHLLPALGHIVATARLKEFYISAMIGVGDETVNVASARILLSHSCQYDYRKSKFYSGEHKALFDDIIPRALAAVFPRLMQHDSAGGYMLDSKVSRDAFVGALCAYSNKRRIELSYTSFSRSHDLRFLVGDMVKHIENRIRGSILVRSKLTTHFLTVPLRKELDAWLDAHLPSPEIAKNKAEMSKPRPEYEALYDLPHTEVSIESADAIEQSSWETTKILVEAFAEDEAELTEFSADFDVHRGEVSPFRTEEAPQVSCVDELKPLNYVNDTPPSELHLTPHDHPLLIALGDRADFVRAVLRGDRAGQKAYCAAHKKLSDAVVDEINDLSVEHEIYDMIIEEDGRGGYLVIEDYRDTVEEMIDM